MSSLTDGPAHGHERALRRAILLSRLAPYLSWAAGFAGVGLVVLFLIQAGLFANLMPQADLTLPTIEKPKQITSEEVTLAGTDKSDQPYHITATRGWQDKDRSELYHMEKMAAKLRRPSGEPYDVTAERATYNDKEKGLDLEGSVVIAEPGRFTARMERAHVKVEDKNLSSNSPVDVELGGGKIHANGLEMTNGGNNIFFLNGVKASFTTGTKEGATP
ncbi:MAG: LPS export ABC transporter periplasmic protein LptC [Alphaproteobacteria bacterium]|nr:LPS export ABC transporter periplasmic protein LptC [Alphaproteobacteria bacterium]